MGPGGGRDIHYMSIDEDDLILLADRDAHQVLAFDTHGNRRFALGERHAPRLQAPFNHPTAASAAPDGEIYVSDGYGNSVVHRFAKDGALRQTWGGRGAGAGEFTTPHCVLGRTGRGRVLRRRPRERPGSRSSIAKGAHLAEWGDFHHPMKIYVDDRGFIFVTDQNPADQHARPLGARSPAGAAARSTGPTGSGAIGPATSTSPSCPPEQVTRLALLPDD